jgi:hypothetical protein
MFKYFSCFFLNLSDNYIFFTEGEFGDVRILNQEKFVVEGVEEALIGNTFLIQRHTEERKKICYWENRWALGTSVWHKEVVNPYLSKYFERLQVTIPYIGRI